MASIAEELRHHSPSDVLSMAVAFVTTRLFFPGAILVRRPFHIRDKKRLSYGAGFTTGRNCRFELFGEGRIALGKNCRIGDNVHIVASESVILGDECLLASKIFISDTSHGDYGTRGCDPAIPPNDRPLTSSPVTIGDNVWLGENVVILPGVTIGDGCVVGANATVTRDLPSNCVAVGSPAHPVKRYDKDSRCWIGSRG